MFFFMRYQLGKDINCIQECLAKVKDQLDCLHHDVGHLHEMLHHQHRLLHTVIRMLQDNKDGMTKEEIDKVVKEANAIADRLGAMNRPPPNVTTGPVSVPKSASNVPK